MSRFAVYILTAAFAAFRASPLAAIPVSWTADTYRVKPLAYTCYHGETLELAAEMTSYGNALDLSGKSATLYWQTNGMSSAWWTTNAAISVGSTGATNLLSAIFSGAFDPGSDSVTGFLAVDGENYRASFSLSYRASPGFTPSTLPAPQIVTQSVGVASIPVRWTVDTYRVNPLVYDCYHGEGFIFYAEMEAYGAPLDLAGKTARLYWQTNGMESTYWVTNAVILAGSQGSSNVLSAALPGGFDTGVDSVTGFIGIEGENYHAAFTLKYHDSPGFIPNSVPPPTEVFDFATVEILNAPYYSKGEDFSNAVLAVGLNIDTNSVAVLNEIAATFGGFPVEGTATTVGGLLAALAAAVAWLKRKKITAPDGGSVGDVLTKTADGVEWTGGGGEGTNAVHYTAETKTDAEKHQARLNIGAITAFRNASGSLCLEY